jgi:hypothetical protein
MSELENLIKASKSEDARIRLKALKEMCPCKVLDDVDALWNRIFEMADDTNADIRYQVLHTMCDGSPSHLESKMAETLEKFNHDSDSKIRRRAHKVMASYLRTGKWNIL